jgi:hypothetical protein
MISGENSAARSLIPREIPALKGRAKFKLPLRGEHLLWACDFCSKVAKTFRIWPDWARNITVAFAVSTYCVRDLLL